MVGVPWLGPPVVPFLTPCWVGRVPLLVGTLSLTSLLEELVGSLKYQTEQPRPEVAPTNAKQRT